MKPIEIDPDIRNAWTLPAWVYREREAFDAQRERVFARSWQLLPPEHDAVAPGDVAPLTLLPGCLDEPLLLARDEGATLRCLSNVCTHRGNLVVDEAGNCRQLRCRYHGRRFGLDGRFLSMPEFEQARAFPAAADDLPRLALEPFGPLRFTSLAPSCAFDAWIAPLHRRVGWLPLDRMVFDAATSRDYDVEANWALYCDNFLEGFHIPYVHAALNEELDYGEYHTETFEHGSVQVGVARSSEERAFDLPPGHPDAERNVAAWYFFLFPNLMLNFYPWGLSVNVVEPRGVDRTRVRFLSYVLDAAKRGSGAGADLHTVELEDEQVVASCQAGVRSRLYERGRYSPTRETCVHHFHRTLARELMNSSG